jgi:PKHD-type hydroxylase
VRLTLPKFTPRFSTVKAGNMAHLPIWYLGSIPHEQCDRVVNELSSIPVRGATMGADGEDTNTTYRDTAIRFAEYNYWFSEVLATHAETGNVECKWGYETNSRESVQFACYGPGQQYNWHVDNFPLAGKPTDRKLSVVCLLNDPSEFEGGEFQMRLYGDYTAPLAKGSIIAFPSILEHRVVPVTKGVRKSATLWLSGPRFK